MNSILTSIKKLLGIDEEYTHFDTDIIIHINSALMTLTQIGVGPAGGYAIDGADDEWSDFLGDSTKLEMVKSYVYMKVRLIFDPPTNSSVTASYEKQIAEFEWRLNAATDFGG